MRRYTRNQMIKAIERMRTTDWSKTSDDYLADHLVLLRRMKLWLDIQSEETKATFRIVQGGKNE
jgi:hypothetical protein